MSSQLSIKVVVSKSNSSTVLEDRQYFDTANEGTMASKIIMAKL